MRIRPRIDTHGPPQRGATLAQGASRARARADGGIVDYVSERIDDRIARVTLEIGELAGVNVDALRFCFDVCATETVLAGAQLDIVRVPGDALRLKQVELI
jgi:hypothetical protein